MNVQEYISSGIVESYVLGLASAEERAEFENMCRTHPEVLDARISFELAMEKQAFRQAITPPPALKQEVMNSLRPEARVVSIGSAPSAPRSNRLRYIAAACAVLLAGSLFWNISQYNRNQKLQASYNELSKEYDSSVLSLAEMEDQVEMLRLNPNMKMAAMKGTPVSPSSYATVYWDTTSKDVYLVVNNLPRPATGKQYQLWALFNGQPIDMGMIDNDYFVDQKHILVLPMKNARNAQAFAITLEKPGGSEKPEGEMYVLGNL